MPNTNMAAGISVHFLQVKHNLCIENCNDSIEIIIIEYPLAIKQIQISKIKIFI